MRPFYKSIRFKLAFVIFLCFILTIILISLLIYRQFTAYTKEELIANARQIAEQTQISVDEYIKSVRQLSYTALLAHDLHSYYDVQGVLHASPQTIQTLEAERLMRAYFTDLTVYNEGIDGVGFSLRDNRHYFNTGQLFADMGYDLSFETWNRMFINNHVGDIAVIRAPISNNTDYFVMIQELREFATRDVFGYMIYSIKNSEIDRLYSNKYMVGKGNMFLFDSQRQLLHGNSDKMGEESVYWNIMDRQTSSDNFTFYESKGKQKLVLYSQSKFTGSIQVGVIDLNELVSGKDIAYRILPLFILMTLLFSVLITGVLTALIVKPISQMIRKLRQVRTGAVPSIFQTVKRDEIGQISNAIAAMLEMNQEMSEAALEQANKSRELEIQNKEAELYALQNQINPHFLYNTLESIRMKALINRDTEVSHMVQILAKLFRIMIKKRGNIVPVMSEFEQIHYYLELQKFRFGDKFEWTIDLQSNIKGRGMLKLIVQPLVENAIVHGLEPMAGKGTLLIRGWLEHGLLCFEVSDSGVGMDGQSLSLLRKRLAAVELLSGSDQTESIGLMNIHRRIRLQYGESFGLSVASVEQVGTTVRVELPFKQEGELLK